MTDVIRIIEVEPVVQPVVRAGIPLKTMARAAWYLSTWPVRWIAGHITALLLRLYVHFMVQANSKAKCPACGIRAEHDVRWSDVVSALIHVCKRCFAVWGEKPITAADQWKTQLVASTDEEGVALNADGSRTTTVQHAQREPQASYTPTNKDKPIVLRMRQKGGAA